MLRSSASTASAQSSGVAERGIGAIAATPECIASQSAVQGVATSPGATAPTPATPSNLDGGKSDPLRRIAAKDKEITVARFRDFLDDRTGYRAALAARRERPLTRRPSWSATLGPCVAMLAAVVAISGLALMTTFSPSATTAWASVHYIEQLQVGPMPVGAFLRGLHYWGGQALIVLFAFYMLRALLTAAYRTPRELAWVTGVLLLPLIVVWALSGSLITGTQTSAGQIGVETTIVGALPLVGPALKRLILGGDEVGHLAITHFYFLHVALLPIVVGLLASLHFWQKRRLPAGGGEGSKSPAAYVGDELSYRPYQSVRNLLILVVVLAAVAYAAWRFGAPLDMPADPEFDHIARPEWYFESLFQLRHFFTGPWEVIATMAVPLALLALLILLPLIDRWLPKVLSVLLRIALAVVCVGGWATLTYVSLAAANDDQEFLASRKQQAEWSDRARLLADHNAIPPEGPISLLRNDAKTQGPRLYRKHCASCHALVDLSDPDGTGNIPAEEPSAPNLFDFATRAWIAGILDVEQIVGEHYFGNTALADGEMVEWVRENIAEMQEDMDEEELTEFRTEIEDVVITLSAEAGLVAQTAVDDRDAERIERGRTAIVETFACTECHKFGDEGDLGAAPDLTGYGSREWLIAIIRDPAHERFYPDTNDRMPSFAPAGEPSPKLDRHSIELIADWLRGDWFEPPE